MKTESLKAQDSIKAAVSSCTTLQNEWFPTIGWLEAIQIVADDTTITQRTVSTALNRLYDTRNWIYTDVEYSICLQEKCKTKFYFIYRTDRYSSPVLEKDVPIWNDRLKNYKAKLPRKNWRQRRPLPVVSPANQVSTPESSTQVSTPESSTPNQIRAPLPYFLPHKVLAGGKHPFEIELPRNYVLMRQQDKNELERLREAEKKRHENFRKAKCTYNQNAQVATAVAEAVCANVSGAAQELQSFASLKAFKELAHLDIEDEELLNILPSKRSRQRLYAAYSSAVKSFKRRNVRFVFRCLLKNKNTGRLTLDLISLIKKTPLSRKNSKK